MLARTFDHALRLRTAASFATWAKAVALQHLHRVIPLSLQASERSDTLGEGSESSRRFSRHAVRAHSPVSGPGSLNARRAVAMTVGNVREILEENYGGGAHMMRVRWGSSLEGDGPPRRSSTTPTWELVSDLKRAPGFDAALAAFQRRKSNLRV